MPGASSARARWGFSDIQAVPALKAAKPRAITERLNHFLMSDPHRGHRRCTRFTNQKAPARTGAAKADESMQNLTEYHKKPIPAAKPKSGRGTRRGWRGAGRRCTCGCTSVAAFLLPGATRRI